MNLETVKGNLNSLFQQYVNKEESKMAINYIFPPQAYGFAKGTFDD